MNVSSLPCDACSMTKQHKLSFPVSYIRSFHISYLIHVGLWEAYKQASLPEAHYVLTIIDVISGATWTILLKNKFNVFLISKTNIIMANLKMTPNKVSPLVEPSDNLRHLRYDHLNYRSLRLLTKKNMVSCHIVEHNKISVGYIYCKMLSLSFSKNSWRV